MNPGAPAGAAGGTSNDVPTLYTLSEVAEATGIPLAELDRYRRRHGDRVPSIVFGETRRYPAEALAVFRDLRREDDAGGPPARGGRRLMSLTAQRRNRVPAPAERERRANDDGAPHEAATTNGGTEHGQEPALPSSPSPWPFAAPIGAGEPAAAPRELAGAATDEGDGAAEADEAERVEVVARSGHEPVPPPSRPARPLFTLHQVHEHTGIPYPTLALYAAAHADGVPSVGERYARLYPWEAMAAFARVHAERTPGWSPPELAPPSTVEAWRRDDGIADRLEQLRRAQDRLADELETLVRDLAGPLTGFARYAEQVPG